MAHLHFARNFERHVACPAGAYPGGSVREVLAGYFATFPQVRSYVLDDQGSLRHHVAIFVNDEQVTDRRTLADVVGEGDHIHVLQALSGG